MNKALKFGIHQPGYHRYYGYFYKIAMSDVFISLDNVQFMRGEWQSRQRFYFNGDYKWLSVPVNKHRESIAKKKIINLDTVRNHWIFIQEVYRKTPFLKDYKDRLAQIYSKDWVYLNDLCDAITKYALEILYINTPYIRASDLIGETAEIYKGELLSALILKYVELNDITADLIYLPGSRKTDEHYLNQKFDNANLTEGEKIEAKGIKIVEYDKLDIKYTQNHYSNTDFIPYQSIFDLIFNHGSESRNILLANMSIYKFKTI